MGSGALTLAFVGGLDPASRSVVSDVCHLRKWQVGCRMCGMAPVLLFLLAVLGCAGVAQKSGEPPDAGADSGIGERAARILTRAIRFRTVNPPGDEAPLAAYLAGVLEEAGIEARVIPTPSG